MALTRVRRAAQVTLPAEVRKALRIKEGDYLDAEVVDGGVMLKLVAVLTRGRAWEKLNETLAQVRDLEPDPNEDVTATEEWIARQVKEHRRQKRKHG